MATAVETADRRSVTGRLRSGSLGKVWRSNSTLVVGAACVFIVIVTAIIGPYIAPYDPLKSDYDAAVEAPSRAHPLGTDKYGRDQLSRILHGARIDLSVGVITTLAPFIIGVVLGSLAGYYGGTVDTLLMRLVDLQTAFPFYVLLIVILSILGPGARNMYIALILVGWIGFARLIRGEVLVAKNKEYILAAKALGYSDIRIMATELLPNVISPALVYSMSSVMTSILSAAALGFLGLGVSPPRPEWGAMIAESREYLTSAWWLPLFPGLAIAFVGLSFMLLGDGLSDLLRGRR